MSSLQENKQENKCAAPKCGRFCGADKFVCYYHWKMLSRDVQRDMYYPETRFRAHVDAIKEIIRQEKGAGNEPL